MRKCIFDICGYTQSETHAQDKYASVHDVLTVIIFCEFPVVVQLQLDNR